ncbi:MAG: RHS repeat protein [Bacteroidales bacterium]|nr:RHS repeat protein [Bacteroidales bacterium]
MKFNCSPNTIILLPAQHRPFGSAVANRVQSITYPDGEVVSYKYDRGGMLLRMDGRKGTQTFKYIDRICYNRYGL